MHQLWCKEGKFITEAKEYVWLFKGILGKIEGVADKEGLAVAIMQEVAKDKRAEEIRAERQKARQEPATARQLSYLKVLGVEPTNELIKQEASRLITRTVAKRQAK